MSDDLTRLTDEEREQIGGYCIGSGEYPCMDDITHRHNLGCKLFDCQREPGDIEHGMLTAVESILAARTAALIAENKRLRDELERAYSFGTDSGL